MILWLSSYLNWQKDRLDGLILQHPCLAGKIWRKRGKIKVKQYFFLEQFFCKKKDFQIFIMSNYMFTKPMRMVSLLETQASTLYYCCPLVHLREILQFWNIGWGFRSIRAILVIIEFDLPFMITKLPAKFHRNRSKTFWVILITDKQKDRLTWVIQYLSPKHSLGWGNKARNINFWMASSLIRPKLQAMAVLIVEAIVLW